MDKIQLDLNVVLPDIDDRDRRVDLLTNRLAAVKGIEEAHITQENGKTQLCLHYDPQSAHTPAGCNVWPGKPARLAGSRHSATSKISFARMDAAGAATTLTQTLEKLPRHVACSRSAPPSWPLSPTIARF